MIHSDYILLLKQLISTPSFSREEKEICDMLEAWMIAHDLKPERIGNNLFVKQTTEATSSKPVVLLNAHIDTVKPASSYTRDPFEPTIDGDVVYGLGSNDDLGSLIALLATFIELKDKETPYRLIFSATAEEEVSGKNGIELILPALGPVDMAIIGEPTCMQLAVAERGLMVLDCTSHGVAGHAAREEGVNAIYKALGDIDWFRSYSFPKVSPYLGPVKMSVTMIQAGKQHNQVPDECTFVVDIRSNGMYTNEEILQVVRENVQCDVTPRSTRLNASHTNTEHDIVASARALGLTFFGSPTLSNQALLPFNSVKIGPGDSARSHTADEYIRLSEIEEAIEIYKKLLAGH